MSNATELLRRAEGLILVTNEGLKLKDDIRTFLATEKEAEPFADSIPKGVLKWNPEAEPVEFLCNATRSKPEPAEKR